MTDTRADTIRDAIAAVKPDLPITVEQTGGGVATIYLGTYDPETGRAEMAIGPGSYNWADPWASTFYLEDDATYIGPDDDGEGFDAGLGLYVGSLDEIAAFVSR